MPGIASLAVGCGQDLRRAGGDVICHQGWQMGLQMMIAQMGYAW